MAASCVAALTTLAACTGEGGDDGVTIHIALGGAGDSEILEPDNPVANGLEEAIGASVVHESSPEDIGASLAAGDSPDIFRVFRSDLQRYVDQGLILDLTPYADQLTDYVNFVGEDTVEYGMIDGRLMAITPHQNNQNDYTYWIRQDWLDNLGLDLPTNAEEFREVLRAFTEDDPDGNGQNDTFGLTGSSPESTFRPLWGAFGTPGPGRIYVDDDGESRASYEDEGMAEAVAYIADLQTSGFVDPDSYSLDPGEARDRGFQGMAGVMDQSWTAVVKEPAASLGEAANPDAEWVQVEQLQQADGSPGMLAKGIDAARVYAFPASLEGDEAKIQKIIDYINYVSTPEGLRLAMWGVEGTQYEMDDDGTITPLPAREDHPGGIYYVYLVAGREQQPYLEALFPDLMEYIDRAHDQPTVTVWQDFITAPESYNQAEAERYAEDQMVQMLTGELPASSYPEFVETLEGQFGYSEFIDAAREQLADINTQT